MIETLLFIVAVIGILVFVVLPAAVIIDWRRMRRGPGPQPWDGEDKNERV